MEKQETLGLENITLGVWKKNEHGNLMTLFSFDMCRCVDPAFFTRAFPT